MQEFSFALLFFTSAWPQLLLAFGICTLFCVGCYFFSSRLTPRKKNPPDFPLKQSLAGHLFFAKVYLGLTVLAAPILGGASVARGYSFLLNSMSWNYGSTALFWFDAAASFGILAAASPFVLGLFYLSRHRGEKDALR